jgi:hypothetical protein
LMCMWGGLSSCYRFVEPRRESLGSVIVQFSHFRLLLRWLCGSPSCNPWGRYLHVIALLNPVVNPSEAL